MKINGKEYTDLVVTMETVKYPDGNLEYKVLTDQKLEKEKQKKRDKKEKRRREEKLAARKKEKANIFKNAFMKKYQDLVNKRLADEEAEKE